MSDEGSAPTPPPPPPPGKRNQNAGVKGESDKSQKKNPTDDRHRDARCVLGASGFGGGRTGRQPNTPRASATLPPESVPITSDTMVSLSPKGMEMYNQMLAAFSAEAGVQLTGQDMLEAFSRVRKTTGKQDVDFNNDATLAAFLQVIRAMGAEKRAGN